jgi:Fur family transcriptional regulator, ferric uptake regulator
MTGRGHSPKRSAEKLVDLTERLRRESRKVTGPRQAILELLRCQSHPLAIREIFAALPAGIIDLATIYRSMHLLEQMRMVKRFDFGDGAARFELVPGGEDGHHHHLVCTRCSVVLEIEECFPERVEKNLAKRSGFQSITHRLEFFGLCPKCQIAKPP